VDLDLVDRVCASFPESNVVGRTEDDRCSLTISHMSGLVTYNVRGFLVDNQEALPGDLATMFLESSADLVRSMYESGEGEPPLLSARAVADLDLVLSLVGPSRLHHVHCMVRVFFWFAHCTH
jgi:hypothetical protein